VPQGGAQHDEERLGDAGPARAHAADPGPQPCAVRGTGIPRRIDLRRAVEELLDVGKQPDLGAHRSQLAGGGCGQVVGQGGAQERK
jgi:hypothetical protein